MDAFTKQYIQTALWSSWDESTPGEPMDRKYGVKDIAPETLTVPGFRKKMKRLLLILRKLVMISG
jgi:hypothetical protein